MVESPLQRFQSFSLCRVILLGQIKKATSRLLLLVLCMTAKSINYFSHYKSLLVKVFRGTTPKASYIVTFVAKYTKCQHLGRFLISVHSERVLHLIKHVSQKVGKLYYP